MSQISKLFVFSPFLSVADQESLITSSAMLSAEIRAIFGTADLKLVNLDEETGFGPLKIEQVRELQLEVAYPPVQHDVRVVVIGNLELASLPAQQALLKLLEEPPEYVQMIVTTSDQSAVLPTILSRCQVIRGDSPTNPVNTPDLPSEVIRAIDVLPAKALSVKDVFALSDRYKERPDAVQLITELINHVHSHHTYPTASLTSIIRKSTETLELLKRNVNTRLAIEELLFELVAKR